MDNLMEKIVSLCKRRGFIYPGSELYGGLNGTWDLGPLGVLLANNVKNEWRKSVIYSEDNIVEIDSSILLSSKTWEASGHVENFTDPLMECRKCHHRFRGDQIPGVKLKKAEKILPNQYGQGLEWVISAEAQCPNCGENVQDNFTQAVSFNLMFKTSIGPVDYINELVKFRDSKTSEKEKEELRKDLKDATVYLRPETAQGIFINYKNVLDSTRIKVPFGIAQIGKGFRNEITTGNFLFRVREFEMMELEYFVKPADAESMYKELIQKRLNWYLNLGIREENIKSVELSKEDLAHYSNGTTEIWYKWPFMNFAELEGIANRGDHDLSAHQKASGKDLSYRDETGESYLPYVIEPSVGVGRAMLAFLIESYHEDGERKVLRLHPKLAPYKVAVFPLLANKEELVNKARKIYEDLKGNMMVAWDDRGNIGKRYFAQDEAGTPYCITVDFQTLEDKTVTVRDRDSAKQERIAVDKLQEYFQNKLK